MFRKLLYSIILTGSSDLSLSLKIQYAIKVLLAFTPVAYLLDSLNLWFVENSQFFSFVIYTLFINIIVGGWYHHVKKTFDWNQFLWKNIQMWIVIVLAYPILEFMRQIAGQNSVGEVFKVTIQIATLLYPASKILKNIYILSNKQYPPSFIMDKIYKFEKDGNVTDLLGKEDSENINEENIEP